MAGAWALLASASLWFGGVFVPPVVGGFHEPDWSLEKGGYPSDCVMESCVTEDGTRLHGFFAPSDEGAPVVVYFEESGGSATKLRAKRYQHSHLPRLGFASLAIDYRGVGLSEGERSPLKLREDARAIYARGLELAGGDPSRVLLRGCSLGTIAIAALLADGIQPGAVILYAPVEASTVAGRFAYASAYGLLARLATPFLAPFEDAGTLDEILRSEVPVFVVAHPADPLLESAELERLRGSLTSKTRVLHTPRLPKPIDQSTSAGLPGHYSLAHTSHRISRAEQAYLRTIYPDAPNVGQRADEVLASCDHPRLDELMERDGFRGRLEKITRWWRHPPPLVAIAAAASLDDSQMTFAKTWLEESWFHSDAMSSSPGRPAKLGRPERTLEELLAVFELDEDPAEAERWVKAIRHCRSELAPAVSLAGDPLWTPERLRSYVQALRGDVSAPDVFLGLDTAVRERDGIVIDVLAADKESPALTGIAMMHQRFAGTSDVRMLVPVRSTERLGIDAEHMTEDDAVKLLRCYLKAAWHGHSVHVDADGAWRLEESW